MMAAASGISPATDHEQSLSKPFGSASTDLVHPLGQWVAQHEFSPVRRFPMSFGWRKVVLAAVATLTLGGVVQASELGLQRIADYSGERFERQDYSRTEHWSERHDPDRYYGRPVPEWQERRSHWGGDYRAPVAERPHWQRPVFAGRDRGHRDRCKIIINERVNRWGEWVQVRREVCR
jgi:hypothetical protein